ncbi:uncharacterized protein PRCAT00001749001 [Priceomyces carsonii]|uniref:uncharacterized protein n=1 Tax=Priceomyces carsonii TaxID=28549 RepID=UPI002EDB622E|nr:unnamed protein product [Priceomyces carsonii]
MVEQITLYSDQIGELVDRTLKIYNSKLKAQPNSRVLICLAGVPGSGKSTLSSYVVNELNKHVSAVVLPQDGFHLYRHELKELPNSEEAIFKRGAPFTFNSLAFLELVKKLDDPAYLDKTIAAPSFSHELKDPSEGKIIITGDTNIIVIEGNYVLLNDENWNEISIHADDSWFMDTPLSVVRDRIIKRHVQSGIVVNEQEAIKRVDESDLLNAKYILANSKPAKVIIKYRTE